VMNAEGGGRRRLTVNADDDDRPAWSPDGRSIAFQSSRDYCNQIYTMRPDGTRQTNLSDRDAQDTAPAWSPAVKRQR